MLTETAATNVEALRYAARELGRRAGLDADEIARWRVEVDRARTTVYPDPNSQARIIFTSDRSKAGRIDRLLELPPSHYAWMADPPRRLLELIPGFIVPFEDPPNEGPLFRLVAPDEVHCRGDILTAALWMLARADERDVNAVDEHGRFRAAASVAGRNGFLERPIVDEYGLALAQALDALMPGRHRPTQMLRVKLSHDIDSIGYPRRARSTAALLLRHHNAGAFARDIASLAGVGNPAYLHAIERVAQISRARGFDSAFYFKGVTQPTPWDTGYDCAQPSIRNAIRRLQEDGFEIGVHPGYDSFHSQALLDAEVRQLRRVVNNAPIGGRQHYLRWDPSTWIAWERAGLVYDSTIGYAEAMGFRAGTCIPYHPWSMLEERELALLEIPLVVMDCTPVDYMRLSSQTMLSRIDALIARAKAVGGVFTLLWHNTGVVHPPYAHLYLKLLDRLEGNARYTWQADTAIAPLPQLIHAS
jgi:hypothetical protein